MLFGLEATQTQFHIPTPKCLNGCCVNKRDRVADKSSFRCVVLSTILLYIPFVINQSIVEKPQSGVSTGSGPL